MKNEPQHRHKILLPHGYEIAYKYYLTENGTDISAQMAEANLFEQLYAGNIPAGSFYTVSLMVKMSACKALPEVMKKVSPLMTRDASPEQNYMGAVMLLHSMIWKAVIYKKEEEALKLAVWGYERWLEHSGTDAPWTLAFFYTRYAEKTNDPDEKKIYLDKAAKIYTKLAMSAETQIALNNAIAGFFIVTKDFSSVKEFLTTIENRLKIEGPLSDAIELPQEPLRNLARYPFSNNTKGSFELLNVFLQFFDSLQIQLAVTAHLLPVLYLSGVDYDVPSGVVFRYCAYSRYTKDHDVRWVDLAMSLAKKYWDGYENNRLFLEAEKAFIKGDERRAGDLLNEYYLNDFDGDYPVRIHSYSGGLESAPVMIEFNKLIDDIKFNIYKAQEY